MDELLSEKEQIEQIRAWWSDYGLYVIGGVVIAVGLLVGFNQYQSSRLEAQVEASELYETLAIHVTDGDLDDAESVANDLASNYANTSYAAQSKLAMARLYMDKNRDQDAADVLNELLALRGNEELKHVGRLRLARILLYQDKAQDVIDLLAANELDAFSALSNELRGDAHAALGNIEAATEAYQQALADPSPAPTINRGLVQMKLVDLPEPEADPAVEEVAEAEPVADVGEEVPTADVAEEETATDVAEETSAVPAEADDEAGEAE